MMFILLVLSFSWKKVVCQHVALEYIVRKNRHWERCTSAGTIASLRERESWCTYVALFCIVDIIEIYSTVTYPFKFSQWWLCPCSNICVTHAWINNCVYPCGICSSNSDNVHVRDGSSDKQFFDFLGDACYEMYVMLVSFEKQWLGLQIMWRELCIYCYEH
jgi:hypothetical protein